MNTQRILASVVLLAVASVPLSAQNVPESCGVRDWFQLRDRVGRGGSSLLCKGATNAAFEHRREAEHELKKVIREAPRSDDALAAHRILTALYHRHGQYRKALSQVDQGLLERPDAEDLKDIRSMLAVLAHFPDLEIADRARSVMEGEINDYGVLCIPLTIHVDCRYRALTQVCALSYRQIDSDTATGKRYITPDAEVFRSNSNQERRTPMQKILIIGYLGGDPELKYTPQGAVIAHFSIATSERWKGKNGELQERTEWFAVKAFVRRAEIAGGYLHKGSRVYPEGRKRTESWDDKKTGSKNYRDLVYVDRIEFLDSRSNSNGESVPDESAEEHNGSSDDVPF